MGVDLCSDHGTESLNWDGWRRLLKLAEHHGWQPEGTAPPEDWDNTQGKPWKGGYCSNDGQLFTDSDARALGEALLRGCEGERENPTEWPNSDWLDGVRRFADFAIKGGFDIW